MKYLFFIISLLLYATSLEAEQENSSARHVYVVANIAAKDISLSRQEVKNLFMGGVIDYELVPVTMAEGNRERTAFHGKVLGLTDARVRSYWAQMKFSGRKQAPYVTENQAEAIKFVQNNEGTVTYINASTPIPDGLTVVYTSN